MTLKQAKDAEARIKALVKTIKRGDTSKVVLPEGKSNIKSQGGKRVNSTHIEL
jgi:hypothetical protein